MSHAVTLHLLDKLQPLFCEQSCRLTILVILTQEITKGATIGNIWNLQIGKILPLDIHTRLNQLTGCKECQIANLLTLLYKVRDLLVAWYDICRRLDFCRRIRYETANDPI